MLEAEGVVGVGEVLDVRDVVLVGEEVSEVGVWWRRLVAAE